VIQLLHIPKTGGTALWSALSGSGAVHRNGHTFILSHLRQGDEAITILRDPAARFVSAFWWMALRHLWPWADPDAMARGIGTAKVDDTLRRTLVFLPQAHWMDADTPLLWVGHTESLATDATRLGTLLGCPMDLPRSNVGEYPPSPLSATATDNIRAFYADDYALLTRL